MDTKIPYTIGYWKSSYEPNLPLPVENSWNVSSDEKQLFINRLKHLLSISDISYYMGYSKCRICGCQNGSAEYYMGTVKSKSRTTRLFIIPQGLETVNKKST